MAKLIALAPAFIRKHLAARHLDRAHQAVLNAQWRTAVDHFDKALGWHHDDPAHWVAYGHALTQTKQVDKAMRAYQIALKLNPNDAHVHRHLGALRRMQGDYAGAIWSLRRAQQLAPSDGAIRDEIRAVTPRLSVIPKQQAGRVFEFAFDEPDLI
ncbi:MAG: tetratricopeptide repeat protein [Neomegalonema sp.]|nr:tetratricopeptide repeat protein [Neomegalonema sp.]